MIGSDMEGAPKHDMILPDLILPRLTGSTFGLVFFSFFSFPPWPTDLPVCLLKPNCAFTPRGKVKDP